MLIPDDDQSWYVRPAHAVPEYESIQQSPSGRTFGDVTRASTHICAYTPTHRDSDPVILLSQI